MAKLLNITVLQHEAWLSVMMQTAVARYVVFLSEDTIKDR